MRAQHWSDQALLGGNIRRKALVSASITDHMRTSKPLFIAATQMALFTTAITPSRAAGPPPASAFEEAVELTGWLHVEDFDFDDATVLLEVNGQISSVPISKTGRIDRKSVV